MTDAERLAPEWARWIADNLARGASPDVVRRALAAQGVPEALAASEVLGRARDIAEARLEMGAELRRRLARCGARVPRVKGLDAARFFDDFYAANRACVIEGWVTEWPAFERWSPSSFAERLGEVEVEVSAGRDAEPDYDMVEERLRRTMRVDALVAAMEAGEGNDLYMIARNRNLARPELAPLLDEVALDPEIVDASKLATGGAQLWMGPAGTVTPLHHDTSNILFCQVYGDKRVTLVPSWEVALVRTARQLYATFDPEAPDVAAHPGMASDAVVTIELRAGEALFIPVGWWHHVRALTPSISLAVVAFTRDNAFEWYRPHNAGR